MLTGSTSLTAVARSSAPTTFDVSPLNGDPDIGATINGSSASATITAQPGQTTTLFAVITPLAIRGSVVRGVLYLDDSSALSNRGPSPSGNQLQAIPYAYKVG